MPGRGNSNMAPSNRGRGGFLSTRGGHFSTQTTEFSQHERQQFPQETDETAPIIPKNLAAWATGLLQGKDGQWLVGYINSPIFKKISKQTKERTGLNLDWTVAAAVALYTAKDTIPKKIQEALNRVKKQVTSSITIRSNESTLQNGVMEYVRNSTTGTNASLLSLSGRHDLRTPSEELRPLPGGSKQVFWWKDMLFLLDTDISDTKADDYADDDQSDSEDNARSTMVVRCFGHSNEPIVAFLKYIEMEAKRSGQLQVIKESVGLETLEIRSKRPLSSIDMEPNMQRQIRREIEDFFHPDSKKLYKDTSRPYRHGFLLHGPPGTGKTSLSVAIASHVGVDLVIIIMQGMDDNQLEATFSGLSLPCVILLEDIDACSADVGPRGASKHSELEQKQKPVEQEEVVDMIEHALSGFRKDQEKIFQFMKEQEAQSQSGSWGEAPNKRQTVTAPEPPSAPKRVTLSGLLNVIDGASAIENRLLIMTTNHPEKLDPALTRAGRCDSKFHLGYATKNSAERTFRRIFAADSCKRHKAESIDRFAKAFKQQFLTTSNIPTCDLTRYCGLYRNRPVEAVRDFAEWLVKGDDMFAYSIPSQNVEEEKVNVAESFATTLLEVGPEDLAPVAIEEDVALEIKTAKRSIFNPLRYITGSTCLVQQELPTAPVAEKTEFNVDDIEYDEWPEFSLFDRFRSAAPFSPQSSAQPEWSLPGGVPDKPEKSCAAEPVDDDEQKVGTPSTSQKSGNTDEGDYVDALGEPNAGEWHDMD